MMTNSAFMRGVCIAAVSAGAFGAAAMADTVYNSPVSPAWTHGNGQPNSGFVVSNANNGTQLGMSAFYRFLGGQNNDLGPVGGTTGPAVYVFNPGLSPTSGNDPTPVAGMAKWNFQFHAAFGQYTASTAQLLLDIDWDPTAGTSICTYDLSALAIANGASSIALVQDSQNLGFGFWNDPAFLAATGASAHIPFDPNSAGTYNFTLRLNLGSHQLNSVSMDVVVIPLPPAAWAGLSTLAGVGLVGFVRRRRLQA